MHATQPFDIAWACATLRRGRPLRIGRLVLRPDMGNDMIWLRDPAGEVEIAATAIDEAGCLAALQEAVRYEMDGPCGHAFELRPSTRST
jgi:hypothetical protein